MRAYQATSSEVMDTAKCHFLPPHTLMIEEHGMVEVSPSSKNRTRLTKMLLQRMPKQHAKRGWLPLDPSHHPECVSIKRSSISSLIDSAIEVSRGISSGHRVHISPEASNEEITRRVNFDLSQTQTYPQQMRLDFISDEERRAVWYTQEEQKAMVIEYKKSLGFCRVKEQDWVKEMVHDVVSPCNQSHSNRLDQKEFQLAVRTIRSDYRGMEADAIPLLKALKRKHRRNVLAYTTDGIPKGLPVDLRERMLAARSLQYSRPHKLFAEVSGYADAGFAKAHWEATWGNNHNA